jgi:23S rRNA (guanosine2251-2'-O)-methyltransferase
VTEAKRGRRRVRRLWTTADLSPSELARLAGSPDHQGVVAQVDPYPYADPDSLLSDHDALVVALDQVQDPRNLGAVCRSAEAVGASGVVIPSRRSAAVTATACKAAAGAVEHLPVARVTNLGDWLVQAKDSGAWIYGAQQRASAAYTEADFSGKVVLVLGSEGRGLRRRIAESCDVLVSIPVAGRVGSLNVSAAAAVLLFEVARQRGAAPNSARGRKAAPASDRARDRRGG